jgi:hypothetical protein
MKARLMSVAAYYQVAVLLTNCYTCLYGNQIGKKFLLKSFTLKEYLIPEIEEDSS